MKKLSLFLSLIMALSAFPAINVEARDHDNQAQASEIQINSHEHEQSQFDTALPDHFEHREILEHSNNLIREPAISETRQKYDILRTSNYSSTQLVNRFYELFGYMSPDYILRNYTQIFDITSVEMDEVILDILTRNSGSGDLEVPERMSFDIYQHQLVDQALLDSIPQPQLPEAVTAPIPFPTPETIHTPTATGAAIHVEYTTDTFYIDPNHIEIEEDILSIGIDPLSASEVNIQVVSVTNTSVILDVFFNPRHFIGNNFLMYFDHTIPNPPYDGDWVYFLGQPLNRPIAQSGRHTITGLTPGATYDFVAGIFNETTNSWIEHTVRVRLPGARAHTFNVISTTSNSVTFNVVFPVERNWGNIVEFWNGSRWVDATGRGYHATSGTYTIPNLPIGSVVRIWSNHFNHFNESWGTDVNRNIRLPLPPQVLVHHSRSNVDFSLDTALTDVWGPTRTSRFMDATNRGYDIIHNLVGGPRPPRMRLESTRSLAWGLEGWSGWPMRWQTTETSGDVLVAIDHAHAMVRLNTDTTEIPIHEIAHNFENQRWLFEPEALAIFKTYYYYTRTGERMAVAGRAGHRAWQGGNDYRTYMRSYADRVFGHIDHERAMAQGVYIIRFPFDNIDHQFNKILKVKI